MLIKVHSAVINPSDIITMRGRFGVQVKYPWTPGWEGSGTVVASGPGMSAEWLVGKRVAFSKQGELKQPFVWGGSMAEYCVTSIRSVTPIAHDVSFE